MKSTDSQTMNCNKCGKTFNKVINGLDYNGKPILNPLPVSLAFLCPHCYKISQIKK